MSAPKDGGQAFPIFPPADRDQVTEGMTLRDYFAAKAMQGLIAQSSGSALNSRKHVAAQYAYEMADAMLAERSKS